jgi:hypothetical protein
MPKKYTIKPPAFNRKTQGEITLVGLDGWWEIKHCPEMTPETEWRVRKYRSDSGWIALVKYLNSRETAEDFIAALRIQEILPLLDEVDGDEA